MVPRVGGWGGAMRSLGWLQPVLCPAKRGEGDAGLSLHTGRPHEDTRVPEWPWEKPALMIPYPSVPDSEKIALLWKPSSLWLLIWQGDKQDLLCLWDKVLSLQDVTGGPLCLWVLSASDTSKAEVFLLA